MKLTILDGNAVNPGDVSWDVFKKYAELRIFPRSSESEVIPRISDSDAIFLNKIVIDETVVSHCPNLKYIGVLATGYNVIDIPAVKKAGICVTHIPSYSTAAVAQHVFALITYFTNQVAFHNESVQNGGWLKSLDFCYWEKPLTELCGKTLGILGYGNIGRQVAKIAAAFGMNVIVCPHRPSPNIPHCVSQDELWETADFITLHAPLTPETNGIICRKSISRMKDGVYLINTARGGLAVEKDVREALDAGKIAGYACDVISAEPMEESCPLYRAPNCIITPHIAWAPVETRQRLLEIAFDNFESWIKGCPKNVIY